MARPTPRPARRPPAQTLRRTPRILWRRTVWQIEAFAPNVAVAVAAATLVAGVSCSPDTERAETLDYLERLRPVLHENSLLAGQVLAVAATVHNGNATDESLKTAWDVDILPLAEHVHVLGQEVRAPPHLAADHAALVRIWQQRADAYREVATAHREADVDAFQRGQKAAGAATLSEDQWARAFNARLKPMKLYVDLYP